VTQNEARSERLEAVAAHPLAELLECPPEAGNLLHGAAKCIEFDAGESVFQQQDPCQGLYVVVSGNFMRKAERMQMRLNLGAARPGDLVELAAALGDGRHTYSLTAQTDGSMLLLPIEGLRRTFDSYPPLRMRLLEELAREVSRAYLVSCVNRSAQNRRPASVSSRG
jgi:CRP-like cAMP-binding protein